MRSSDARDPQEVRPGVPRGCGPDRRGDRQADRLGGSGPGGQRGHAGQPGGPGVERVGQRARRREEFVMADDQLLGDLYFYESLLSEDERKDLRSIREFLQTEVKPQVAERWEAATFPMDLIPRFAEEGLVGRSYDTEGSPRAS